MTQKNKPSKQLTLYNLSVPSKTNADKSISKETQKQIVITEVTALTQVDDLILKIAFKLSPSKTAFSRLKLELWFEKQRVISLPIRIPEGSLAADEYEVAPVLNMKRMPAGRYIVKVELYELGSSGEKLVQAEKELSVDYLPQTRELRFVKVPTVRSVAGADLVVISESEVEIYMGIEKTTKKEQLSKRDTL